jgi:hypothetical protein
MIASFQQVRLRLNVGSASFCQRKSGLKSVTIGSRRGFSAFLIDPLQSLTPRAAAVLVDEVTPGGRVE